MVEIPIDKLPIESVVIGNEKGPSVAVGIDPYGKPTHDRLRVVKPERFFACEPADSQGFGNPVIGNRSELAIKRLLQ